ncbi:MAG: PfkB family carbohydrate kinase [Pelovirga sp.]
MNEFRWLGVFGEVLFDCFPSGEEVLGGAPFNVAWHLQALGDNPLFISRVGADAPGQRIRAAMTEWEMACDTLQVDAVHPTGRVEVTLEDGQPQYRIMAPAAYDFIRDDELAVPPGDFILYHGTLALRHGTSRAALDALAGRPGAAIFIDVNLRSPWWNRQETLLWLARARWAKMNEEELRALGFDAGAVETAMTALQEEYAVAQLIVTRGADGALVRSRDGTFHRVVPPPQGQLVDTIGAGDAFSAVYLHGLLAGWPIERILAMAQQLAGVIVAQRGAIPADRALYRDFH